MMALDQRAERGAFTGAALDGTGAPAGVPGGAFSAVTGQSERPAFSLAVIGAWAAREPPQ